MILKGAEAALLPEARPRRGRASDLRRGRDARGLEAARGLCGAGRPEGEAEMRLTRMSGADLRKDGSLLLDAIKGGRVLPRPARGRPEDATDGLAEVVGFCSGRGGSLAMR